MNDILVSVIVVTYNSSATVLDTLDSIYQQTYKNLELVVTDDCSKDDTVRIIKLWLEKNKNRFSNVLVLEHEKNHGVVSNCNDGVKHTNGKYVQLIAGDDIFYADAIDNRVNIAENNPNKIVVTKVEVFGDLNNKKFMEEFCERGYEILKKPRNIKYKKLLKNNYIAGPSWSFLPKDIYTQCGLYDERFPMLEDYPFLVKMFQYGYDLVFSDTVCTRYRVHSKSISQQNDVSEFTDSLCDFYMLVLRKAMLKERMFYSVLTENINWYRYSLKKKYGKSSILYKLSFFLYIVNPKKLVESILIKLK